MHPLITIVLFLVLALLLILLQLTRGLHRLQVERDQLLRQKDVAYSFSHDVGELFTNADTVDLNSLLRRMLFYAQRTTKASAGAVYLTDDGGDTLSARALAGVFPPIVGGMTGDASREFSMIRYAEQLVRQQSAAVGQGLIGEVAASGQAICVRDAEMDARIPRFSEDFLQVHSLLAVPMRFHHGVMGVLAVANPVDEEPFTENDLNLLQALADQASVAIYYAKFSADVEAKQRLDRDLSVAKVIQKSLLPRQIPSGLGAEISAFSIPAQQIGGDYYDFVRVDEDCHGIAVADVSGKGIPGAMVMSLCRSALRSLAAGNPSPAAVLKSVNRILSPDLFEDMYVTMVYAVYDSRSRQMLVARAGHPAPLLFRARSGEVSGVEPAGVAIGLGDPDLFDAAIAETSLQLQPGDIALFYTDGISEAMDRQRNEWGLLNLVNTLQLTGQSREGAASVGQTVQRKLLSFVGDTAQYDDMTLVAMKAL